MFNTSAPYVVTILVSAASWFLMTFHSEMNDRYILQYDVSGEELDENISPGRGVESTNTIEYLFSNISPNKTITDITVIIRCPASYWECIRRYDQIHEPPWAMALEPVEAKYTVEQPLFLPPGMSFRAKVFLADADIKPVLLFSSVNPSIPGLRIERGEPISVWLANNFLLVTVILWGISVCLIVASYVLPRRSTNRSVGSALVYVNYNRKAREVE